MVQVLPAVPSFGEKLANALGQGLGDIGEAHIQKGINQKDQDIINSFDPNDSPINQIKKFSQLSSKKQQTLTPLLQQYMKTQSTQQIANQKKQADMLEKQAEQEKEHEDVSQSVNSLMDKIEEGSVGKYNQWNKLFEYGRENRAYFDEIALGIEKRLATMVGKGALSKPRFEYLLKQLPKSDETDASNRGKLKALAEEFKVIRKKGGQTSKENRPSLEAIFQ